MKLNIYEIAWAIARYERMIAGGLTESQSSCAMRYGKLVDKHFARLTAKQKSRVLGMVPDFMDVDFYG